MKVERDRGSEELREQRMGLCTFPVSQIDVLPCSTSRVSPRPFAATQFVAALRPPKFISVA